MDAEKLIELCKKYNIIAQKRIIRIVAKDILTMTDDEWLELFVNFDMDNDSIVRKTRTGFSSLYDILINIGVTSYNPFDSEKLKVNHILRVTGLNTYITPNELKEELEKLGKTKDYAECFPRLIYEGLYEYKDFYNLKNYDIDFKNKKIYLPNFTINMSEELNDAMLKHSKSTKLYKSKVDNAYVGSFFRTINRYPSADNITDFLNVISYYVNIVGLKKIHLYGSGFINFLLKKCGTIEKLDDLFFDDLNYKGLIKDLVKEIEEYGREYGLELEGKLIRYRYKKYYNSFKYKYNAENLKPD